MFGNKGGRKGRGARHGPTVAPGGQGDSLRPRSQQGMNPSVSSNTLLGRTRDRPTPQTPRNNLLQWKGVGRR